MVLLQMQSENSLTKGQIKTPSVQVVSTEDKCSPFGRWQNFRPLQKDEICTDRKENIVGKGESADYQLFFFFFHVFKMLFLRDTI